MRFRLTLLLGYSALVPLLACTPESAHREEGVGVKSSTVTFNALTGNALTGNALTGNALTGNALTGNALTGNALTGNALTGNALTGNALTGNALTGNGVTNGQEAREVLRYVYGCAMPAGSRMTLTIDGQKYTFDGAIGLAPQWGAPGGTCDHTCQRWISACVLARTNAFGIPVPISIRGPHPALGGVTDEEQALFPLREGSYYGSIFGGNSYGEARLGCTGPTSNEPALTARLCSNGGTEGGLVSPCGMVIGEECFVAPADRFTDPVFGSPPFDCKTQGADGHITDCLGPRDSIAEVITVFLKNPVPIAGNGVCEAGESHATTSDCSLGWAKLLADRSLADPTAGVAVDGSDQIVTAGRTTGEPDFGGGPIAAGSGFFLARFGNDGKHLGSLRVGSGETIPKVIAADAGGNVFVGGAYRGTASVGGASLTSPNDTEFGRPLFEGFVAKFSATGAHLWSVKTPGVGAIAQLAIDAAGHPVAAGAGDAGGLGSSPSGASSTIRFDSATGATLKTIGHSGGGAVHGLAIDPAGNLLISDALGVSLHTPDGTLAWTAPTGGSLAVDSSGHFYTATMGFDLRPGTVSRFKYTTVGAESEWSQPIIADPGILLDASLDETDDHHLQIAVGRDGNVVIGGTYSIRFQLGLTVFTRVRDSIFAGGFVVKLSPDGSVLWAKDLATPINSPVAGIALDSTSAVAVAGTFEGNVIIDGFTLSSPRQSVRATSSEMYLAKIKDQLVGTQPNDRAGGAIKIPTLGDGVLVETFEGLDFTTLRNTTIDETVRLRSAPDTAFSTRWSGVIESDITDTVTFTLDSIGAARLVIDGTTVIDDFADHATASSKTGTFEMVAHRRYDIRVDYRHRAGGALLDLAWQSVNQKTKEPVPTSALTSQRTRTVSGTTRGLADDYQGSCGGSGAPDATYFFKLTEPTRVRLSTLASGFDTVLHVRDGASTAAEVGCNDDIATAVQSGLDLNLGVGTYLVTVDGASGASGNYQLSLVFDPIATNDTDTDAVFVSDNNNGGRFYGTTTGYRNDNTGSCGGDGAGDAAYRLVLTKPRQLHVDTNGSDFDTVLHIRRSGGGEVACADDNDGEDLTSSIDVALPAGVYFVYVDGKGTAGGTYRADFHLEPAVDTTPPTLTQPPAITAIATSSGGAVVTYVMPTATDNLDDSVDVACAPASGSLFPLGTSTVTCTARDDANNTATVTFGVSVMYLFSGFLQPINADGSSVFKRGSTIPLKFALTGASAGITNAVARVFVAKLSNNVIGDEAEASSTAAASLGNQFRYDALSGQYVFNLGTKGLSTGTYQIRIDLGDGVSRTVLISLN